MLCSICHEREATIHTTAITPDGTHKSNLGAQCSNSDSSRGPSERTIRELLARGKCKYCGGEPASGVSMSATDRDDERELEFTCTLCNTVYCEFLEMSGVPSDYPDDESAQKEWSARWEKVHAEAEAYVRQKARERQKPQ
jgi:protein-arginine kinase activator protein McsA